VAGLPRSPGRCRRGPKSGGRVRDDERLRAELELAHHYRLPRRIVLGAPWPGPGEPLFTPEDTELALEYLALLHDRCGGCGHPISETTALDEHGRPAHDYEARSTVCQACEAKAQMKRSIETQSQGDSSAFDGRLFYVLKAEEGP
jgi:hypothetical protein